MMKGKTVIITGCTSGIGKETARDLAKRECRLIMACRNVESANKFKDELTAESGNNNIIVQKLDLSSFRSIRAFAEVINQQEPRIDVLIHNAGMAGSLSRKTSEDGLELTMATNQHGPFLLTILLIDLLKRSAPSRIVIVASCLYQLASLNLNNLNPVSRLPGNSYNLSKCTNVVWCLELARRLKSTGVTVNCLHPGVVNTPIGRTLPPPLSWMWNIAGRVFFKTPVQGAQTSIYLATSDEVEGVTGKYFVDSKEHALREFVKDPVKAQKFWELSEALVQLRETDPRI